MINGRIGRKVTATSSSRWLITLAALVLFGLSGQAKLRRAALRGVISAALMQVVSLLPGWTRQDRDDGAVAAFITAASLELPVLAAPLVGAAVVADPSVARRVMSTPASAIGAMTALSTTRLWPIPPRLGAEAPRIQLPHYAEPNEDGAGLTIVINTASGSSTDEELVKQLRSAFPESEVAQIEGDELRPALDEALDHGAKVLGVAGGDGSINTAAQVAVDSEKVLMIVPNGTFNHLGQALGVDSVVDAIEAVKAGQAVAVDVGTIGGHVFLNTASFGSYVELVDAREKLEGRIGKWLAVLVALIRVLRHGAPIEVEVDGRPLKIWMAFIGNCRYHPSGFAPTWRERLDDELLDFRYVSGAEPFARTRLTLAVLTGRLGRSKVYREICVTRLHVRSRQGPIRLARDGETFEGPEDFVVEKLSKRIAIYVPHSKKA